MTDLLNIPSRDDAGNVYVVVEAPRGSWTKLKYDPQLKAIVFGRPLPLGITYPYDWGFIPSTRAEDDDPLDAMVLFDAPTASGVVIPSIPVGVVRIAQKETKGSRSIENDRIIAVPAGDDRYQHVRDLPKRVRKELEIFFVSAGRLSHASVEVRSWDGPKKALAAIDRAASRYAKRGEKKGAS